MGHFYFLQYAQVLLITKQLHHTTLRRDLVAPVYGQLIRVNYCPSLFLVLSKQNEFTNVVELEKLLEEKRNEMRRNVLGDDTDISSNGFVDTTKEVVLTSEKAHALARESLILTIQRRRQSS